MYQVWSPPAFPRPSYSNWRWRRIDGRVPTFGVDISTSARRREKLLIPKESPLTLLSKTVGRLSLAAFLPDPQGIPWTMSKMSKNQKFLEIPAAISRRGSILAKKCLERGNQVEVSSIEWDHFQVPSLSGRWRYLCLKILNLRFCHFWPSFGFQTLTLRSDPGQMGVCTRDLIEFYQHAKFQPDRWRL